MGRVKVGGLHSYLCTKCKCYQLTRQTKIEEQKEDSDSMYFSPNRLPWWPRSYNRCGRHPPQMTTSDLYTVTYNIYDISHRIIQRLHYSRGAGRSFTQEWCSIKCGTVLTRPWHCSHRWKSCHHSKLRFVHDVWFWETHAMWWHLQLRRLRSQFNCIL